RCLLWKLRIFPRSSMEVDGFRSPTTPSSSVLRMCRSIGYGRGGSRSTSWREPLGARARRPSDQAEDSAAHEGLIGAPCPFGGVLLDTCTSEDPRADYDCAMPAA